MNIKRIAFLRVIAKPALCKFYESRHRTKSHIVDLEFSRPILAIDAFHAIKRFLNDKNDEESKPNQSDKRSRARNLLDRTRLRYSVEIKREIEKMEKYGDEYYRPCVTSGASLHNRQDYRDPREATRLQWGKEYVTIIEKLWIWTIVPGNRWSQLRRNIVLSYYVFSFVFFFWYDVCEEDFDLTTLG